MKCSNSLRFHGSTEPFGSELRAELLAEVRRFYVKMRESSIKYRLSAHPNNSWRLPVILRRSRRIWAVQGLQHVRARISYGQILRVAQHDNG